MIKTLRRMAVVACLIAATSLVPRGQMRVSPLDVEQGRVALGLALRHLDNTGIFMHTTAHPDDEDNGLLVMLNRGLGYRTILATATRGNGGQNEIGPEIFEALGVLRTEELAAIHRFDGAEQYFTRAVDFGYSFSADETFEKWGREDIVSDYVRLIRMTRPDVMLSLSPSGTGGGQHHQASAVISREAFDRAGDPTQFPEQIEEGLRPWQPTKFFIRGGRFGGEADTPADAQIVSVNLATYDPLLGRTYAEIGTEARSMHKCQGMGQLLSLPGPSVSRVQLVDVAGRRQQGQPGGGTSLFDGIDTSLGGLSRFAGSRPPRALTQGLEAIEVFVVEARRAFDFGEDDAVVQPLLAGLGAVRGLRGALRGMGIGDAGRRELEFRLLQKEREFQQAIVLASGLRVEALADDGVVVPGQSVDVSVIVANRGRSSVTVHGVNFDGFSTDPACDLRAVVGGGRGFGGRGRAPVGEGPAVSTLSADQVAMCTPRLSIPASARISEPYWHRDGEAGRYTFDADAPFGLPYRPTSFYVQVGMTIGPSTEDVYVGLPVQYRYEGNIFSGEKRSELLVVPPLSVRVSPEVVILPTSALDDASQVDERQREIRVTVTNTAKGGTEGLVTLDVPSGWTVTPERTEVSLVREDESETVRFQVQAAEGAEPGGHPIRATVSAAGSEFGRGFQVIEYPHIRRQHIYYPAETMLKLIDVEIDPELLVGYVMGVGDEVPSAITQLGASVEMLDADDLAWGDLSRFHTIVTGVRAYERRGDLRANNDRLIDYVRNGGRLVVQYNKFEFNAAQYGPYAAEVSSNRVTSEFAPVKILEPSDQILTKPNAITDETWEGWVQERGLYFMGARDSRYRDLISLEDEFPNNPGEKRGALIVANYGKGRWIYVGLGLWRELPAGVDGAYQLLANLISSNPGD